MGKEIERKFLVTGDDWRSAEYSNYVQGYLSIDKERTVRVRMTDDKAFLTIKGITRHATREEYEYSIPVDDAESMLRQLCLRPLIEKRRYFIKHAGMTWEVDDFQGENAGLVVAEIELDDEQQAFDKPDWVGEEITADKRYYNASLVAAPFSTWSA
ncbi:MAG: CYTH domain-containing protein [Nitrosomonas sp.]|nr:MAG: CYTH domain-containing protein [Nitrosomonas sp.]